MKPEPINQYIITPHAAFEMKRRGIREDIVRDVLRSPGQRLDIRTGRIVLQSKLCDEGKGKESLIRVFVDIHRELPEVVTVYRTAKIVKYWKETP